MSFTALCFFLALGPHAALSLKMPMQDTLCKEIENSLCKNSPDSKPLLITGVGGSGTSSIAGLMNLNGISLAHELIGRDGSVSWPYAVDVLRAAPNFNHWESWLNPPHHTFNHVVHLTRCPIDVISALQTHSRASMLYIRDTLGLPFPDEKVQTIKFYMTAWLKWNEHIESYAESRYRIDEFFDASQFSSLTNNVGLPTNGRLVLPTGHENHRPHHHLTWSQLQKVDWQLAEQLKHKAGEYGFGQSCVNDVQTDLSTINVNPHTVITTGYPGASCDSSEDCVHDSILLFWDRATVENLFNPEDMFEDVASAIQHLEHINAVQKHYADDIKNLGYM